jgi:hypothetical protein
MFKNGNGGTTIDPWFLLLAVPEMVAQAASAPTITSVSFTQNGATVDVGAFSQTTAGSIYTFAGGLTGDSSMNAANMFCDGAIPCANSNEISTYRQLPNYFEIFKYSFAPAIANNTAYKFDTSGMIAGTYLAAAGGSNPFSTPFTVTGLVQGTPTTTTPEPSVLILLGSGLIGLAVLRRQKLTPR